MNYDDFDYLDGTLSEWLEKFDYDMDMRTNTVVFEERLQAEYLPRFEAAIHKIHSTNNSAWTHPYVEQLPFEVITADEEIPATVHGGELITRLEGLQPTLDMPEHIKDYLNKDDSYKDGYSILA